jgi:enediyne biosynthesis protein E4
VISDAKNWPTMGSRSLAGYQQKRVWINDGAGRFVNVAPMVGVSDRLDGRSIALADLGRHGMLDAVVANQRGPLLLYRNDVAAGRHWIALALEGGCSTSPSNGTCSNRSAIGAQATVYWGGRKQVQEVSGGSGFCAQNDRQLHFGLGDTAAVEKVVIRWPSGRSSEILNPAPDQVHKVKEPL